MNQNRSRYVGGLLWLTCLALTLGLLGSLGSALDGSGLVRDTELQKVQEGLAKFFEDPTAPAFSLSDLSVLERRLSEARNGASLIDTRLLLALSMLAITGLGLASILMMGLDQKTAPFRLGSKRREPAQSEGLDHYGQPLDETLEQLQRVSLELNQLSQLPLSRSENRFQPETFGARFDELVRIQGQLGGMQSEIAFSLATIKDVADHLQGLARQCEENAQFTAATRLEWGSMGSKLRLLRDQHNKLKSTADKVSKQQATLCEMIGKALDFGSGQDKYAVNAKEQIQKMNEISKETLNTLDLLASSMAESNQDVGAASALVRGLSERAEEIVNIIDVIDDIAEQTNQLALNASIEAARAGEQGQGFAVVAGEVRNLAARSSTATKSITDLLGTIQQEADHASSCLEKTNKSVGLAHSKTLEVDRSYREGVHLSRQALNSLTQLISNAAEQTSELKAVERQAHDLKKYASSILGQLEEQGRLTTSACTDSTSLMQHSDRLARLLSRQYFEIAHCDRMVEGTFRNLSGVKGGLEESLARSDSLRSSVQNLYVESLQTNSVLEASGQAKISRAAATLHACSKNLEVITASPEKTRDALKVLYRSIGSTESSELPLDDLNVEEMNQTTQEKAG